MMQNVKPLKLQLFEISARLKRIKYCLDFEKSVFKRWLPYGDKFRETAEGGSLMFNSLLGASANIWNFSSCDKLYLVNQIETANKNASYEVSR